MVAVTVHRLGCGGVYRFWAAQMTVGARLSMRGDEHRGMLTPLAALGI
ncbi:hypothetical protein I552_0476 [Mycobacterium xenopi 3993]|nr:hypothetical protein I552_0476 [Mycobacterium xenopi 3993]